MTTSKRARDITARIEQSIRVNQEIHVTIPMLSVGDFPRHVRGGPSHTMSIRYISQVEAVAKRIATFTMITWRLIVLLSLIQWQCYALLSNNGGGWNAVLSKITNGPPPAPSPEKQCEMALEKLNLTSSIEPKPFSVEPSSIPAILGASIPVSRLLFGFLVV